jgi:thioredoxin 1
MSVVEITSKSQFDALVKSTPYVALQAHATWCGPCKAISPFFAKHADALSQPGTFTFAKFDTDDVSDLAFELGIRSIPAFFFFENGEKDQDLTGPKPQVLKQLIEGYADKAKAAPAGAEAEAAAAPTPAPAPVEEKKDAGAVSRL